MVGVRDFKRLIQTDKTTCRVVELDGEDYGIYRYDKGVFVIFQGSDSPINSFSEEIKEQLLEKLKNGDFVLDKSFC